MVIYKTQESGKARRDPGAGVFEFRDVSLRVILESPRIAHCNPECVIVTYGFHGYCRVGFSIVCHVGKKRSVPGGSGSN